MKPTLTNRQKQILRLATHTNKYIARLLNISAKTVANHLTNIYKALHLSHVPPTPCARRTIALTTAIEQGIIDIDEVSPGDRPVFKD